MTSIRYRITSAAAQKKTQGICKLLLAAAAALAGCDRPAAPPVENPGSAKNNFSGFETTGSIPLPLSTPERIVQEPTPTPAPTIAPEAQAAKADLSKALSDYRSDPAVRPPPDVNLHALQSLNNAIIGHIQQIEEAEDRVRATRKKEPGEGTGGE